jgi:hypothetical protein
MWRATSPGATSEIAKMAIETSNMVSNIKPRRRMIYLAICTPAGEDAH